MTDENAGVERVEVYGVVYIIYVDVSLPKP